MSRTTLQLRRNAGHIVALAVATPCRANAVLRMHSDWCLVRARLRVRVGVRVRVRVRARARAKARARARARVRVRMRG